MEDARILVLNCLNHERKEKFDYSQIIWIFREAKRRGHTSGFEWFSHQCEFEARPVTRDEQKDRLMTVVEQSTKTLESALSMLKSLA